MESNYSVYKERPFWLITRLSTGRKQVTGNSAMVISLLCSQIEFEAQGLKSDYIIEDLTGIAPQVLYAEQSTIK